MKQNNRHHRPNKIEEPCKSAVEDFFRLDLETEIEKRFQLLQLSLNINAQCMICNKQLPSSFIQLSKHYFTCTHEKVKFQKVEHSHNYIHKLPSLLDTEQMMDPEDELIQICGITDEKYTLKNTLHKNDQKSSTGKIDYKDSTNYNQRQKYRQKQKQKYIDPLKGRSQFLEELRVYCQISTNTLDARKSGFRKYFSQYNNITKENLINFIKKENSTEYDFHVAYEQVEIKQTLKKIRRLLRKNIKQNEEEEDF